MLQESHEQGRLHVVCTALTVPLYYYYSLRPHCILIVVHPLSNPGVVIAAGDVAPTVSTFARVCACLPGLPDYIPIYSDHLVNCETMHNQSSSLPRSFRFRPRWLLRFNGNVWCGILSRVQRFG